MTALSSTDSGKNWFSKYGALSVWMLPSAFELSVFMKYAHDASNSDSAQSAEFCVELLEVLDRRVELLRRVEHARHLELRELAVVVDVVGRVLLRALLADDEDLLERVDGRLAFVLADVRHALEELRLDEELAVAATCWNSAIALSKSPSPPWR